MGGKRGEKRGRGRLGTINNLEFEHGKGFRVP